MVRHLLIAAICFVPLIPLQAEDYKLEVSSDNRVWVGPEFWANRLHDWRVQDGRIECIANSPRLRNRTLSLLTHDVPEIEAGTLNVAVRFGSLNGTDVTVNDDAVAGVILGVGPNMDYRSRALIHGATGNGSGTLFGVTADGRFITRDLTKMVTPTTSAGPMGALPRGKWKIAAVDSDEGGRSAANVLDGSRTTIWHTEWTQKKVPYPHEIVIDMASVQSIDGIAMLPRQGNVAGRIKGYKLFLATTLPDTDDGWGTAVSTGEFPDKPSLQRINFKRTSARYFKLVGTSAHQNRPSSTIAELYALDSKTRNKTAPPAKPQTVGPLRDATMVLSLQKIDGNDAVIDVVVLQGGSELRTTVRLPKERIAGGLALLSHGGIVREKKEFGKFCFNDFRVMGTLVKQNAHRAIGPILSAMYTIDRGVLKLTAQMLPISESASQQVTLEATSGDGKWRTVDTAEIVTPGWTVPFRVENWDTSKDQELRVVYDNNGTKTNFHCWTPKDPVEKKEIVVAGFTGNHMVGHGFERDGYDFDESVWFPHAEVVKAVNHHKPDVLFFSGDQVYEGGSPTFADTKPENIKLDYLYKWFLWCWAYRDLTRRLPTICEPDDHDVYQGNIWGQGGRKSPGRDHEGGYVHPADFVKMVERTQTSHLPDPYSDEPVGQGILPYYSDLTWGEVGIAILEDRKFKSGCKRPSMPPSGTGRPDHFNDPDFNVADLDVDGLTLLGEKQLEFIDAFAQDWEGQKMKIAASQTIFANMATHHGGGLSRLIADLDSNGWPQTGRNLAVAGLRRGSIFHLGGDQHLATIVHHGIDDHEDAIWSFCVPSVANFYPRAWAPKLTGEYTWPEPEDFTGNHRDGFGHPVTVYAASNPGKDMGHEPARLHNGMPGYGIVRLNKPNRTITMECWPRWSDPSQPNAKQYAGWPKTITQFENDGRKPFGELMKLKVDGASDPVVQVINEATKEVVSTVRILGNEHTVSAFKPGTYRVLVKYGQSTKTFAGLKPIADAKSVTVSF